MRLERASSISAHSEHDARVVSRAAEQEREHRGATEAAVSPESATAVQNPIDVKGEMLRGHALTAARNAREPREGARCREELQRAGDRRARGDDLQLGAQPHASER